MLTFWGLSKNFNVHRITYPPVCTPAARDGVLSWSLCTWSTPWEKSYISPGDIQGNWFPLWLLETDIFFISLDIRPTNIAPMCQQDSRGVLLRFHSKFCRGYICNPLFQWSLQCTSLKLPEIREWNCSSIGVRPEVHPTLDNSKKRLKGFLLHPIARNSTRSNKELSKSTWQKEKGWSFENMSP